MEPGSSKRHYFILSSVSWRNQLSIAFSLMTVIPLLTLGYFILSYILPSMITLESLTLVILLNVLISLGGYLIIAKTIKTLSEFSKHLKSIADGDLSAKFAGGNGPDVQAITASIEKIVNRLAEDNRRLSTASITLEDEVKAKTEDLLKTNQELRNSNMKLSDALSRLKELQQNIIRYERLNSLGQMASGIAHDMNNALMPIKGFSEMLLNDENVRKNPELSKEFLTDIIKSADDAKNIVSQLRDFASVETDLQLVMLNINSLLDDAAHVVALKIKGHFSKGGQVTLEKKYSDLPEIPGDKHKLKEVFLNILFNSVDAMPRGGVIEITTSASAKYALIRISDTGGGMSEDVARKCMEPFFTTKGASGTGMGLSIAYGIIRQHNGTIEIESRPGRGTTVELRIPLKQDRYVHGPESAAEINIPPLNVLLVDDDERTTKPMEQTMTHAGLKVTIAKNAAEGLVLFVENSQTIDLVITDMAMPDMSGDVLAAKIKAMKPTMPIVLLSGFGQQMNDTGQKPDSVDIVIGKPATTKDIFKAIAQAAKKRQTG